MKGDVPRSILRLALLLIAVAAVATVTTLRIAHSRPRTLDRRSTETPEAEKARIHGLLLAGVGSQVSLLNEGARSGQVQASIDSMGNFIRARSGLSLSGEVTDLLTRMEQQTLDGKSRRITCDELSDTILVSLADRLRRSADTEIEQVADRLANNRGVKAASPLGASGDNHANAVRAAGWNHSGRSNSHELRLRADGRGFMSRDAFLWKAKEYRRLLNSPVQTMALMGIARRLVRDEFQDRVELLSKGMPEQWGDSIARGLTPARAFLVSYSVISDDVLFRSTEDLQSSMAGLESAWRESGHDSLAAGRVAFGSNGYIFSSPVDLVFDSNTSLNILNRLAEMTSR